MEAKEFLEWLWEFKDAEHGWILLWRLTGRRSSWHRTAEEAAAAIEPDARDVYVQGCLGARPGTERERVRTNDAIAACGLWADVDYGPPTKAKTPPPDEESARTLIDACGLTPTLVVHSGHGLQAWWLFGEIWPLEGGDRLRFSRTLERWQWHLRAHAEQRGWTIDYTHDLSRVMRVPGTINAKVESEPVPVRIIERGGTRYQLDDFEALLMDVPSKQGEVATIGCINGLTIHSQANPPAEKFVALMENSARFKKTWRRQRPDMRDQSASGYCCSLAHHGIQAAWTDQQIVDLLVAWRRKEGEALKSDRPEWYARTIAHARQAYDTDEVIGALSSGREIEAEDLEEVRRTALEEASRIFGHPLLRFVQVGRDDATYELVFRGDNGTEIRCEIGSSEDLDSKPKVRAKLREKVGVVLHPRLKPSEWQTFVDTRLLRIVEIQEPEAGDVVEDLWQTVMSYLATTSTARDETEEGWEGACMTGRPFVRGDRLYLSARTLRQWISRVEAPPRGFYGRLRAAGFRSEVLNVEDTTRSVWWIPLERVRVAVEVTEE